MTNTTLLYAGILLIGVFLSAISQVLLKKAAARQYVSKLKEYLNPLLSVYAYKGIPLFKGPVLEATSYIYITIFGVCIFKEKLNPKKIVALLLIVGGILVYSLLG